MIEAIILKLCFAEGELQEYLKENASVPYVIHASMEEEEVEEQCYLVRIDEW